MCWSRVRNTRATLLHAATRYYSVPVPHSALGFGFIREKEVCDNVTVLTCSRLPGPFALLRSHKTSLNHVSPSSFLFVLFFICNLVLRNI